MKTTGARRINTVTTHRIFSILSVVAILVVTSCGDDDPSDGDRLACQLSTATTDMTYKEGGNLVYNLKIVSSYTYDQNENITESEYIYDYKYTNGATAHTTSTNSNQYNDRGFLIRTVQQSNSLDAAGESRVTTGNSDLTYEHDRVVKVAYTYTDNGVPLSYEEQFEYDNEGKLIRYTTTYNTSLTIKIEYSGKSVLKVTQTTGAGKVSSPFLQYNDKGLLVKGIDSSNGYSDENRYEYTADGNVAREERYIDGKPSGGTAYEYDTRENPYRAINSTRKGIPFIPSTRASFLFNHNYTTITSLAANDDATAFKNNGSTVYVYEYNDKNFPTTSTAKSVDSSGQETAKGTTVYTYQNCP
jgi:hypothetical protein